MTVETSGILRRLGIVGIDELEPIVLAALATESPLLLIGPHGTAKSMLLERLSKALDLTWRHYNASLLSYNDLVGYPLPDKDGKLRFIETPASIWGAQAVFLDEISRCRADMQNRLFPIVHERKVQGMPLEDLRHRWAAMNPPFDPETDEEGYAGSEPLDLALADRFPFVVTMPVFADLTSEDQEALICTSTEPIPPEVGHQLRAALDEVRHRLPVVESALGEVLAEYARLIVLRSRAIGMELSGRRAAMIYRNMLAVHAAGPMLGEHDVGRLSWRALWASIPLAASGKPVPRAKLLAIHREVWQAAGYDRADPRRLLVAESDPVRRALLAVELEQVDLPTRSSYVADALASLPSGGRHAFAHQLCEESTLAVHPAVAEQIGDLQAQLIVPCEISRMEVGGGPSHRTAERIVEVLAQTMVADGGEPHPDHDLLSNLLPALYEAGELVRPGDVRPVVRSWSRTRRGLGALPRGKEILLR